MIQGPGEGTPDDAADEHGQAEAPPAEQASEAESAGSGRPGLPPHLAAMVSETRNLERTKLDHSALQDLVARTEADKQEKLQEEIKARASEPLKPYRPIENYRMASPCASDWERLSGQGRVRFCSGCQLQVYDLTGMEVPEAEELIFQRESRKDFRLFKRQDGKFLTSDCPIGAASKKQLALTIAGGLVLAALLAFICATMPPPKSRAPSAATTQPPAGARIRSAEQKPAGKSAGASGEAALPAPQNGAAQTPGGAPNEPTQAQPYGYAPAPASPYAPLQSGGSSPGAAPPAEPPTRSPNPAPGASPYGQQQYGYPPTASPSSAPSQPAYVPAQEASQPAPPAVPAPGSELGGTTLPAGPPATEPAQPAAPGGTSNQPAGGPTPQPGVWQRPQ